MYKVLFWALLFMIYVAVMWLFPITAENHHGYLMGVLAMHIIVFGLLAFAWLVGFLHDKAFN